jgi:glycosyltransferase involved in cell wall biosynthesis
MIKSTFGIERSYYPNYIMDEYVLPNNLERGKQIKLLYFGRVVPEKNVDVVIKVASLMRQKGYDVVLDIIGGCSAEYQKELNNVVSDEKMEDIVTFHGRKPFPFIAEILHKSHYYIFPSSEANEGHSNSLTEAMGCGVVPIVSKAGFNESICGNIDLVADDLLPQTYMSIIEKIEREGKWGTYSTFCYNRVINNYTQSIVSKKLIDYVTPLFYR